MNDAYASVAGMGLPGGESINLWHGTDPREFNGIISGNKTLPPFDKLATYYTRVNIYIKKELPLGVIVNRDPTTGEPHWIKEPGLHEGVWAWKEEIDQACSMGCLVTSVGRAWGWTYLDHTSSKRWVLTMRYLRSTAPTADLQDLVKLAIVAALGSHARDRYKRIPCDLFESDYSFILDEDDPNEIPMGCKQIINKRSCNLNHWYSYIMAKTRVILLGRMLAELKLGNRIIRADYDAIILEDESKVEICPYHKDTTNEYQFLRNKINLFKQLELELGQPPTWKQRRLTNITIPYPRALISNEKTRLPGNIEFNTRKL
jgi:hypothetical protein